MQPHQVRLQAQELQLQASARLEPVLFHGKSMLPFIEDGDELTIETVAWESIQPGDIITYRLADRFPTCRVASKQGDHLVLIADNWRGASYEAWREDVLGRVSALKRGNQTLRRTDAEWVRYAQGILLRRRARRTAARVRTQVARVRNKAEDAWVIWRKGYTELPRGIQINVSSRCNLHCRMCPYLEIHKNPNVQRYMTAETFTKLMPVVKDIGAVSFCGAGEPLFHKELLHFMEMTRQAGPQTHIELTTNATMLTREIAAELIRLRVRKVHLSLDGLHPETVTAIRRGIPHSRVLENIRGLAELKKETKSPFPILMINYMMGYGTYGEFADFILLARELGATEIQVLEMQPATAEDYADNMLNNLDRDQGRMLREAIKRASQAGIRLHLHGVVKDACYHPYTPHIGEDGEVYPCCFLDYDGRQLYSEGQEVRLEPISYGNINKTSFREIWNSPAYVELRTRDAVGDFPDYCRTCYNVRAETADKITQILGPR